MTVYGPQRQQVCCACGSAEGVRLFPSGPRCPQDTPAAAAGRPEPPQGYCAPLRCYCGQPTCPAYESYDRPDDP